MSSSRSKPGSSKQSNNYFTNAFGQGGTEVIDDQGSTSSSQDTTPAEDFHATKRSSGPESGSSRKPHKKNQQSQSKPVVVPSTQIASVAELASKTLDEALTQCNEGADHMPNTVGLFFNRLFVNVKLDSNDSEWLNLPISAIPAGDINDINSRVFVPLDEDHINRVAQSLIDQIKKSLDSSTNCLGQLLMAQVVARFHPRSILAAIPSMVSSFPGSKLGLSISPRHQHALLSIGQQLLTAEDPSFALVYALEICSHTALQHPDSKAFHLFQRAWKRYKKKMVSSVSENVSIRAAGNFIHDLQSCYASNHPNIASFAGEFQTILFELPLLLTPEDRPELWRESLYGLQQSAADLIIPYLLDSLLAENSAEYANFIRDAYSKPPPCLALFMQELSKANYSQASEQSYTNLVNLANHLTPWVTSNSKQKRQGVSNDLIDATQDFITSIVGVVDFGTKKQPTTSTKRSSGPKEKDGLCATLAIVFYVMILSMIGAYYFWVNSEPTTRLLIKQQVSQVYSAIQPTLTHVENVLKIREIESTLSPMITTALEQATLLLKWVVMEEIPTLWSELKIFLVHVHDFIQSLHATQSAKLWDLLSSHEGINSLKTLWQNTQ